MADTATQNRPAKSTPAKSNGKAPAAPLFDSAFLTAPLVTADNATIKAAAQPKNKRSEAQLALDGVTPQIHQAWVRAGKPAAFGKLPTVSYPVDPAKATKLRGMIRKAADFNGTRARFGQDVTITPDMARETQGLNESHVGLVLITFGVVDKSAAAKQTDEPAK